MGIPRNAAAYALPFACLFCGQCAKDPPDVNRRCNDLVAAGPLFDYVSVSDPVPAAMGGTIEDGIYYENKAEVFDPTQAGRPSGMQRSVTNVISGETWQVAYTITETTGTRTGTAARHWLLVHGIRVGRFDLAYARGYPSRTFGSQAYHRRESGLSATAILDGMQAGKA